MDQNIFRQAPLIQRSFFQKLFKQYPGENVVIELNNLLATKPVLQINSHEVAAIEHRYKISLEKEFKLNLEEFYAVYLNYCLKDQALSDEELKELQHLKHILNLDDKTIQNLHSKMGAIVYRKSFEEAVSDGRLTKNEESFLAKLESELKLPKEIAEKISAETRTNFIQGYVNSAINDQRLSPDEEKELEAIAKSLNVTITHDKETKEQLRKLKLYWALENLELPEVETTIALQKSECCYAVIDNVVWHELRSVRQRTSYTGYSTSFRIAKGFYLRAGSYTPRSYATDQMKLIDSGSLYLTNKRIIFTGTKKNSTIRLEKIIFITPYADGVELGKETGKSPLLLLPERADVFCIILERLLRER